MAKATGAKKRARRPRCSPWVDGEGVADLVVQRRDVDVHGVLRSGFLSDTNGASLLAHGRRLTNTFLLRSSAPARRARTPTSPPLPRLLLLLPSPGGGSGTGAKTPMRVVASPDAPCPTFELAPRNLEGEKPRLPLVRRRPGPDGGRGLAPPASDA
jgi:hypothetical protein